MVLRDTERVAEALVVDDLTLTKEFQGIADVGIVDKAQKVVVSDARLLFCCDCVNTTFSRKQALCMMKDIFVILILLLRTIITLNTESAMMIRSIPMMD